MGDVQNTAHDLRRVGALVGVGQLQVDAINLVLHVTAVVFEAQHGSIQRDIYKVVQILAGHAFNSAAGTKLRPNDADHVQPLVIHLHEFTHRFVLPEDSGLSRFTEYGNGHGVTGLIRVKEASCDHAQVGNFFVVRVNSVNCGN